MKVQLKKINKSFYDNHVLKDVDFDLIEGEVHALVGENGAGKSTLMKILTGILKRDSGEIYIDGNQINMQSINDSMNLDISFLHQELNTFSNMSIWENMFIGRETKNKFGFLDVQSMRKLTENKLSEVGLEIDVDTLMKDLPIGRQQLIGIASALLWNKKIIILDEPTSALTNREIDILFEVINRLKKERVSFVYITHRLEEIFNICDRVTILRDGSIIGTDLVRNLELDDIIKMMVGYDLSERYPQSNAIRQEKIMEIKNLSNNGYFENVNFDLYKGEILGFSGLMGSGRTEIMQTIFGILKGYRGEIYINGDLVNVKSPLTAKKHGIAYITENRKEEGILLDFSISENITLPNLKIILNKVNIIDNKKQVALSEKYVKKLDIKTENINKEVYTLSGGNQQKVVVGKWLATAPVILILDEPTRGVDVGAKYEIYEIINQLKENGVAIIMISSELPEVIGMSDRIAVMHEGVLKRILTKEEFNQERIMSLSTGGK